MDKEVKKAAEILEQRLKTLEDNKDNAATRESLDKSTKELEDFKAENNNTLKGFVKTEDVKELNNEVKELKEEIASLKENTSPVTNGNSILSVIKANKEGIRKSIDAKGSSNEFVVNKDVFTRASITNNTNSLRLNDIGQIATRKLTIYDLFKKVPVGVGLNGVVSYADWDEDTTVYNASAIAEGTVFNQSKAVFEEKRMSLKKIGVEIPITEETLTDEPRFANELNSFLEIDVAIEEDNQLYGGDGTGANLTGLYTYAPAFVPVASGISDASIYDLIIKVSESITKGKRSKNKPDFAVMNVTDINQMRLKKDANNNYVMPPFVDPSGNVIGIRIVESNVVAAGTMVVGDSRYGSIYEVEGYNITTGFVADQFTKDLMTLKARSRKGFLIRDVDANAFAKVGNISAALVTLGQ